EGDAGGDRLYYLSVGPELYTQIVQRLGEGGQAAEDQGGFRRLVVEKPFGRDLKSALEVNEHLHEHFKERQIYRIDHYLGKDTADRLRNEKAKVLDAILVPSPEEARANVAVGQYAGYLKEKDVPADSRTPTYAAVKLLVENWRWKGVPFYLRSGKGLRSRYSEVAIQFREPPFRLFPQPPGHEPEPNRITIILQPNEG